MNKETPFNFNTDSGKQASKILHSLGYKYKQLDDRLDWVAPSNTSMPDGDLHGECATEIHALTGRIAEPASQWVSVAERLPEFGQEVLTCHRYADSDLFDVGIHWRDGPDIEQGTGNTANFLFGSAYGVLVTHWMPLPPPPATPKEQS